MSNLPTANRLLTAGHTGVVLIDVQEKLTRVMNASEQTVARCGVVLQSARALGLPIFWCQQVPRAIGPTVTPLLAHLDGEEPFDKSSFSCLGAPGFAQRLDAQNIETAVLCGIESHVCVFQTAMDLLQKGMYVHVVADAVTSRTPENKQIGIDRMAAAGAVITSTEMLLFELLATADHDQFKPLARLIK